MTAVKIAIPKPRGSFKQRKQVPIGTRFGHLVTIAPVRWEPSVSPSHLGFYEAIVPCRCDCGKTKDRKLADIKCGKLTSCGCRMASRQKRGIPHSHGGCVNGQIGSLYGIWAGIKRRCALHVLRPHKNYALKGIIICEEWKDFAVFRNCQWVTLSENCSRAAVARRTREQWMIREIMRLTARVDELERENNT